MRLAATAERLAVPRSLAALRESVAAALRFGAFASLNVAIVLSPFRARAYFEERPLPPVFADYTDILVFWCEVFVVAMLGFWVLSLIVQPRRLDFGPPLVWVPVAVVVVSLFAAVPFSDDQELAVYNAVKISGFVLMAVCVANELKNIAYILPAIGVMIAIQAVVATTQVISQHEFGLTALGEFDLDPAVSGVSVVWTEDSPRLLRAYGLSDHPNILAGVLAAALLVVLACVARFRDAWLAIACGVFGAGVATVMLTFSRGGALGLAAGIAVGLLLLLAKRRWSTLALWAAAGVMAVIVTAPLVRPYTSYLLARANLTEQAAGSTEERSITERDAVNENTLEMIRHNPLTGVGAGVLPTAMKEAYPEFIYHYQPAHIVILVVAAETGIVGAGAYGLLMLAPWALLWVRRRHLTPELIGVSGAVMALTVVGLFDYYTWGLMAGRFWFWLVLALWVIAYRQSGRQAAGV